jgi:hypothetical protein
VLGPAERVGQRSYFVVDKEAALRYKMVLRRSESPVRSEKPIEELKTIHGKPDV